MQQRKYTGSRPPTSAGSQKSGDSGVVVGGGGSAMGESVDQ
jgi:hypothetical protein